MHRFAIDVDPATGGISEFRVLQTLIFRKGRTALDLMDAHPVRYRYV